MPTVVQLHSKSTSQGKQFNEGEFPVLRRSERIKNCLPMSYKKEVIPDDYILCAQSFVYETPTLFHQIKYGDDRMR